jgi:hypothetical protein
MKEFKQGIFETLKELVGTSFGRAVIYTIGHVINGVWYYALDRMWASRAKG